MALMTTDTKSIETKSFEADVSQLLHLMVHSVYSDRDVFLRELISNAADACEKLRYEAIERPDLLGWPRRWAPSRAPARAPSWKG